MERIQAEIRKNWETKLENIGFGYHSLEGLYWDESHYYQLTSAEINALETATAELWQMCLEAVDYVISKNLWFRFNIPEYFRKYIMTSWEEDHPSIYGRFDLGFDGHQIKLLEFNADTPTSLYEASVVQWYWLQEMFPHKDQFNSIHEKLVDYWGYLKKYMNPHYIYFSSLTNIGWSQIASATFCFCKIIFFWVDFNKIWITFLAFLGQKVTHILFPATTALFFIVID